MNVKVLDRDGVRIVECTDSITRVDDALDLIAACIERGSTRLLIDSRHLPAAFFDLRSKFAGEFLQKLQNYRLRVAAVFLSEHEYGERFSEFLSEAKRGNSFRAFTVRTDAEAWLAFQ
ncbi:MAG: DUF4180 domain-containing protein [Deltaproteobacteria bacterium]|nr:DUF4180 domain-containing protein [Deltaproteobacteria bacterium]MBI3388551.1 DUF4180 domain-containing protein [Deltaproteobacteria bacterium]